MAATKTGLCDECLSHQEWVGIFDKLYVLVEDAKECEHCAERQAELAESQEAARQEAYYGGEGPQTLREQHEAAYRERLELRRQ